MRLLRMLLHDDQQIEDIRRVMEPLKEGLQKHVTRFMNSAGLQLTDLIYIRNDTVRFMNVLMHNRNRI